MKPSPSISACLLQPYLAPYRLGLLNELNRRLEGGLTVLYFWKEERARKWTIERQAEFREIQLRISAKEEGYDRNRVRLSFASLAWHLLKIRPAVVIANESPPGRWVRYLQPFLGFRLLFWSETNLLTLGPVAPRRWFARWLDRGASAYLVPGRMGERYLLEARGYKGRIWMVPNTIDRQRFSVTSEEVVQRFRDDEIRFLFSGSLIPLKGIDPLFEAFSRLAGTEGVPAYRLDIIGDGPIEKRSIKNVHYHGFLSQDGCASFMKRAHVLVLPSLWDCNPLVVTEAATAGCATLLSDGVGNWPEYTDGNGFVFERGNADSLYQSLLKVLGMTREERSRMALRSLEIASGVSHENSARIFLEAIHECLRHENPPTLKPEMGHGKTWRDVAATKKRSRAKTRRRKVSQKSWRLCDLSEAGAR